MRYPVVIHKDPGDYGVTVPDLPGCFSAKITGKARRVNVTIPERVLSLIDDYVARHGETRSGLITQATLEFLAEQAEPH